jgi:hypothetical protein
MSAAISSKTGVNVWSAALYSGIITAIPAVAAALLFGSNQVILAVVAFLFTGIGPVLGYQLAAGRLGSDIKSIIGGLIGGIPVLGIILWPILVGAMSRGQSVGKLLLGSLLGLVLGFVVFGVLANAMGQDPANFATLAILGVTVWAGTAGAFMANSGA